MEYSRQRTAVGNEVGWKMTFAITPSIMDYRIAAKGAPITSKKTPDLIYDTRDTLW